MRTQTLQAPMQVVQMTGDVLVVLANGATRPLLPGEVLPAGTTLQLADNATLQLAPPDGGAAADAANAAPSGDAVPQPAATGVGAEVAAIQQALLEGVDPTLNLEATAAGGAPAAGGGGAGGSGNGGFVSIDRTGDSTLATAGFDTTYQAGATTDVLNPVAATVVDVPAPIITPDSSSVSESNLNADNELDTDLVDGTQAGQGSTTVQGNLNVDFGGATGSVSFLPVETQPALTSGGQPLVWALSDDGLTLTGSVNGTVIMTVTLAADGSSYTVDLDGALDNGVDPLAIAIGIQAQNDAGAITSGQIVLTVADDAPLAQDDALSVGEDNTTTVTGNVLVNDQVGADGAVVTAQTVTNELGSLVLGTDGQYSFTLNSSNPSVQALTEGETLTQVYSYTLTDADGDTSTANLTITITGSDDGIVITDLTPSTQGGEGVVFEDDLANGSDASKEPLSVEGTFSVSAPDGLQSITIGGVVVTLAQLQDAAANPVALSSALGNSLTITGFSDGVVSYTYTLLSNEAHMAAGNDGLFDNTSVVVTDRDGDTASSNLSIQIVDDVPTAVADSASIAEDAELLTVEGNVLTSDTQGADGAVVTPQTVESALGTLELESNGEYSFTLNNDNPSVQALTEGETLTQVYSYTLTDGDGDTSTANLTMTITGSDDGVVITDLTPAGEGGEGVVFEDDLANGSDASKEPLSVDGTFSVSAPDGLQSITIGGVVVTLAQLQDAAANPVALSSALGNSLTITGFSDGVVSYTYTLLGNETHPDAGNDVLLDNTTIVVTDRDGDTASSNLSIQIVDDVPEISIAAIPNTVVEGESLTTGTWELNAGADGATVAVIVGGVSYALGEEIDTGKGLLTVANDGTWSFVAADDLDNTDPQTVSFTLKATDGDQDVDEATQTITITDGNEPEWGGEVDSADLTVDEAALSVLGGDTGTDPTSLAETDSSGTLQFKAGSDAIDSIVFGDPSDISIAGIDTDNMVWTLSLDGRTLTGAVGSEDVLKLTLEGASSVAVDGTGNVTVKAELLGNLLHQDVPNAGSLVVSGITVVGADDDGDNLTANVTVTVNDDVPDISIAATPNTVVEGESLTTGTWSLNAGADGATVAVIVGGVSYALGEEIDTGKGLLTVANDGTWSFVAADDLDNTDPQTVSFTLKATDGDQDVDEATQTITITDGNEPEWGGEVNSADLTVDEAALSVLGGDTGTDPTSLAETDSSGTLQFKAGSDAIDSIVFGDPSGISIAGIDTSNIVWSLSTDGRTLTGAVGGTDVLKLTLDGATGVAVDGTGNVTVKAELLGNLLHQDVPNAGSLVVSGITVVGADDDGDNLTANVTVTVNDDVPDISIAATPNTVVEGASLTTGTWALTAGADGAAVAVVVGGVSYALGEEINTGKGTLTVHTDGSWSFAAADDLDHDTLQQVSFTLTATDGDMDVDDATQTITITDGSGPEWGGEVNSANLTVDEAALAVVGSDPTSPAESDSSGTLQFQAGSDAIDSIVFGDPSGISIAGIDTSNIVWSLSTDGRTLTGAVGSEDVLRLTLDGASSVAVDGTGNVTVKAELLGNLLHQDVPNAGSLVVSGITVVGAGDDGDSLTANVTVTVNDDVPDISIAATPNTVVEGASLTTGTWALTAGADGAAVAVVVGGVSYALGEEINTGKGTLTVHADGSWSFAAADDLDHDTLQQVSFTLTATDGDMDVDDATQTITITDGRGPEWGGEVNSANLTVDEAALAVVGSDPTSPAESDSSGTLQFQAGSDAIDSIVFGDPSGISIAGIDTSNIVWSLSTDGRTLTGAVGSEDVLRLTLDGASSVAVDGTGNVTVKAELLGNLLHQDVPNAGSLVVSGITVVGADDDGDSLTADVRVTVTDDSPTAVADTVQSGAVSTSSVNLVLMLDTSGSIGDTNMALIKSAVANLITTYGSALKSVMVVDFDDDAVVLQYNGKTWLTGSEAINRINQSDVKSGGETDYDDALAVVRSQYVSTATERPAADQTYVYFLSDGEPYGSDGTNSNSISSTERTGWTTFLTTQGVDEVYAIGIGSGVSQTDSDLLSVAWTSNTSGNSANNVILISSASQLSGTLTQIASTSVGYVTNNDVWGADGESAVALRSVSFDIDGAGGAAATVYTFDATHTSYTINLGTNIGTLQIGSNGAYTYTPPSSGATGNPVSLNYTIVDGDGDISTSTLTIEPNHAPVAVDDQIITNILSGTLTIPSASLVANDTDVDGDTLTTSALIVDTGWTAKGSDLSRATVMTKSVSGDKATLSRGDFSTAAQAANTAKLVVTGKLDKLSQSDITDTLTLALVAGEILSLDYALAATTNNDTDIRLEYRLGTSGAFTTLADGDSFTATSSGDYQIRLVNLDDNGGISGGTDAENYTLNLFINYAGAADNTPTLTDTYTVSDSRGGEDDGAISVAYQAGNVLTGTDGNDTLIAGDSDTTLNGGAGNDVLFGGAGTDTLRGGLGADILTGGDGADIFKYMSADKDANVDIIKDFTLNQDKLGLADVLNDPTGSLSDYLSVTGSGDDALVKVYSAGNASGGGTADLTIVLDGLASTSTELQQLQDYLLNQDGVIK